MSDSTSETIMIQLTQGQVAVIDAVDADLADFKWYARKVEGGRYYAARKVRNGKNWDTVFLHHVILERKENSVLAKGYVVDHKDNNSLNNKRDNLRAATRSQNNQNSKTRKDNLSGLRGVSWHKKAKRWFSRIVVDGTTIHLGFFNTPESAHQAYLQAAKEHFGEFARLE